MMRSRVVSLLCALPLCVAIGCSTAEEEEAPPVVTVGLAPVATKDIERIIRAQAVIYPLKQAAIVPKIAAPIKKVYVARGDRVREGQLLLELENADLAGAAQESAAALQLAEANYETAARATVPQETQKAELELQAAKTALDAQQAIFDSRQQLVREGAIAQKDLNDAQVALTQARNQYEIASRRLADLRGFGQEQALKAAAAERDQARGRQQAAQAALSYSRIVSPIAGTVTEQPMYAGETPASGAPVITVMDLTQVIARAHISPSEAAELAVGKPARIIAAGDEPVDGRITQISPALDAGGTTVEVWVQAPNPGERLKPGISARVELVARTVAGAHVVPESALLTDPSGETAVIVVDGENTPHKEKVSVGIRDAGHAQIVDGVKDGQRVATTGAFELGKLDPDVLATTKVQIEDAKKDEAEP